MEKQFDNSAAEKVETVSSALENEEAKTAAEIPEKEEVANKNGVKRVKTEKKAKNPARFSARKTDAKKNKNREKKERLRVEREERIAAERQERYRLKKEKAAIRAKLLSEKRENKKLLKMQKREQKAKSKREQRSRGIGGWLAAVIALGCSTLLLGTLLTFNVFYMSGGNELLDNMYRRAFYDLTGYVDNIDVNLGKLEVASSPARQQKILNEIVVQSELAENELQALPLEDASRYATGKYINQLGDYAKTLSEKLADGGSLTENDRENLKEFGRRNQNLQKTLSRISADAGEKYSFLSLLKPADDDAVLTNMNELENLSLEYPKMIYDGPFSDGLKRAEAKGLTGSEITKKEAVEKFRALFSDYALTEAEVVNECGGDIETYNVSAVTEKGWPVYAQMAKRGGAPVLFNCYAPCNEEKFTLEECREIAEVFVKKAGFEEMKPVWETASRGVAQFNFAHVKNGITVYSDLVKVNVCMERGVVSALDAASYCLNHIQREIPEAVISEKTAIKGVSSLMDVRSVRKVIVPVGQAGEKLAYEVFGINGGSQYFVYIDAATGKELDIYKVVESTEGTLVI